MTEMYRTSSMGDVVRSAREAECGSPTRDGSVEAELSILRDRVSNLGDSLQELRGRLSIVFRNSPKKECQSAHNSVCTAGSPEQCTVAANIYQARRQVETLRDGVVEMMDALDLN